MNASLLSGIALAPRDPILGVTEAYVADTNLNKVNLGVGVYYDDDGKVPILESVRHAELKLAERPSPRSYLPIDGLQTYDRAVQGLLFGPQSEAVTQGRIVTAQALGGTGGLKLGADLLRRINPGATSGSATRAGRTTGRCSNTQDSRSTPIPTTTLPLTA